MNDKKLLTSEKIQKSLEETILNLQTSMENDKKIFIEKIKILETINKRKDEEIKELKDNILSNKNIDRIIRFSNPMTKQHIGKIFNQMNSSIYKVRGNNNNYGVCFLSHIKYNNKNIPVIIANNHILDKQYFSKNSYIDISINNRKIKIEFGDIKYFNRKEDISIIEIKENNIDEANYIELDDSLYENETENFHDGQSIYIINFNNKNNVLISFGMISNIQDSEISYLNCLNSIPEFSPIFNLSNSKLMGIHKYSSKYYNKGLFFKFIIKDFINKIKFSNKLAKSNNQNINNEIHLLVNVSEKDINKEIYFLDNIDYYDEEKQIKYYHNLFNELNVFNLKIYINEKEYKFTKYFIPDKIGDYKIKIKFNINLINCSFMFYGCNNIIDINFNYFNSEQVNNMKGMFYECDCLKNINLFTFNTKNVVDMSFMFFRCYELKNLDLCSFNTKNVNNMSSMFKSCKNLNNINISSFNTEIVIDMDFMFFGCENLDSLDLLSFNTKNVKNMSCMFERCKNIKNLNFSSFNTENVTDMNSMFYECENLNNLDLSFFNTEKVTNLSSIFYSCKNLKNINLTSFHTKNVLDMRNMFNNCRNLINLDLSSFNTKNVKDMSNMFNGCISMKYLNISSFDTTNTNDMTEMFYGCNNLNSLDLSSFNTKNVKHIRRIFFGCPKNILDDNKAIFKNFDNNVMSNFF